jgi:hypothetical protein
MSVSDMKPSLGGQLFASEQPSHHRTRLEASATAATKMAGSTGLATCAWKPA